MMKELIVNILNQYHDRFMIWEKFIQQNNCKKIVEIGVYKGEFAEYILTKCDQITKYIMIDPWRNLSDWNKPANKENSVFEGFFRETLQKTNFAKDKREILRGKTMEVIQKIDNNDIDFVYIDGDHTLKGITVDLINIWDKVKPTGFIAGDDFSPTIWQHNYDFEPTLIFPFAIYFAEAMDTKIYALPYKQFLITKEADGFEFIDLTDGIYKNTTLRQHFVNSNKKKARIKIMLKKGLPGLYKTYKKIHKQ